MTDDGNGSAAEQNVYFWIANLILLVAEIVTLFPVLGGDPSGIQYIAPFFILMPASGIAVACMLVTRRARWDVTVAAPVVAFVAAMTPSITSDPNPIRQFTIAAFVIHVVLLTVSLIRRSSDQRRAVRDAETKLVDEDE